MARSPPTRSPPHRHPCRHDASIAMAGQISLDGPADLVSGWVRVAMALDTAPQSETDDRA